MKFYIETYGCTANFGNSREAAEELCRLGHVPADLRSADVLIINSCAVTARTERRLQKRLRQLEGRRLVVAGCLPQAVPQSLQGIRMHGAVGVLNRSGIGDLAALLGSSPGGAFEDGDGDLSAPPCPTRGDDSGDSGDSGDKGDRGGKRDKDDKDDKDDGGDEDDRDEGGRGCEGDDSGDRVGQELAAGQRMDLCGIVNISEGCLGRCAYCLVRKARGGLASRGEREIAKMVDRMVRSGLVEIQLASQDAAAYGRDRQSSLPRLLHEIRKIPGSYKIRVGMMNPDTALPVLDQLVRAFQDPRVYRFLHLPLQSGSARVLKEMKRGYSPEQFLEVVSRFREAFPDLSLTTDVIAGYPGETEEDFQATLELLRMVGPDKVNVTRYSRRPGTPAALRYDMPDRIKKDRSRELTRLWLEIAGTRNRHYIGQVLDARVTECGRGATMKARSANYTGIVILGAPDLGSLCQTKIIGSNPFYLKGILQL